MNEEFYEPQEDSTLFVQTLKQNLFSDVSSVLDVGTGSGILAQTAHQIYPNAKIDAIDINKKALTFANKHCSAQISFFESNLFEHVSSTYNLILCNPPYLPKHHLDLDDMYTKALVGGIKGYEYILELLEKAQHYLSEDGRLIVLFSSLSNSNHILEYAHKLLYETRLLSQKRVGLMEDLYVYECKPLKQLSELRKKGVRNISYLAKGKRGVVLKGLFEDVPVAIKIPHQQCTNPILIEKEAQNLKKVNKLGIGPRYITHTNTYVIREFVEGTMIKDVLRSISTIQQQKLCIRILTQLRTLDKAQLQKEELTNPYKHIIVTRKNTVVQIDFERMKFVQKPKNVTQFFQYIFSHNTDIPLSVQKCQKVLQAYKQNQSDEHFTQILNLLS